MDKDTKFTLPSPNFDKKSQQQNAKSKPHYLTPSGMTLLPRERQPPPMFGPRGATVPAKYLEQQNTEITKPQSLNAPRPERQYCEPCDMELQSAEDLRIHRAQHECCPVEGCNFRGHMCIMDKHIGTLHATGLFESVKKLSTPEEIAAWRAERRKKYPTLVNVQMRQRAQEQRQKRGERLEGKQSRFGNREDRKRLQNGKRETGNFDATQSNNAEKERRNPRKDKRANKRRKPMQGQEGKGATQAKIGMGNKAKTQIEDMGEGVVIFRGTSQLKNYRHAKTKRTTTVNALTSLLGMYGSDDDESDEQSNESEAESENNIEAQVDEIMGGKEEEVSHKEEPKSEVTATALCKEEEQKLQEKAVQCEEKTEDCNLDSNKGATEELIVMDVGEAAANICSSDEGPDEAPVERTSDLPDKGSLPHVVQPKNENKASSQAKKPFKPELPKAIKKNKPKSGLNYRRLRQHRPNTMLEKLLEQDIRHERNVLLQCVRYVCENNFFDIAK